MTIYIKYPPELQMVRDLKAEIAGWLPCPPECPVDPETVVSTRLASGMVTHDGIEACCLSWLRASRCGDQYRIVKPAEQPKQEPSLSFLFQIHDTDRYHYARPNDEMKRRDIEGMAKPVRPRWVGVDLAAKPPRDLKANLLIVHDADKPYAAWMKGE